MEPEIERRFERLENLLGETEKRLGEQLRDMQTELLKAFLPWQGRVRIQFRELEANTGNSVLATKQRMDIVERRLGKIEKRPFLNPRVSWTNDPKAYAFQFATDSIRASIATTSGFGARRMMRPFDLHSNLTPCVRIPPTT
jgi:hypothetical protein